MPGVSGVTVVTNARVFYTTRGCGRIGRPAFPAPSEFRGDDGRVKLGRAAPRDRGAMSDVIACDKREAFAQESKATRQSILAILLCSTKWIASLALAMTADSKIVNFAR
jgi:hypothetical protein